MLYTEFQVGGKALKLRITARACVAMEKKARPESRQHIPGRRFREPPYPI